MLCLTQLCTLSSSVAEHHAVKQQTYALRHGMAWMKIMASSGKHISALVKPFKKVLVKEEQWALQLENTHERKQGADYLLQQWFLRH